MSSLETSRQNNFDLLRLAAALQVAFLHCVEHLKIPLSDLGFALASLFPGVPIFFVISGFLISASFERTRSTRRYFINRILRIYPALWVCLAVSIASFLAFGHVRFRYRDFLLWLVAQISFFQFYNPDFLRNYGIGVLNGSLWTIPVELQFYALLPLLYRVWRRLHWSNTVALSIIAALIATNQIFVAIRAGGGAGALALKLTGVTVFPYLYMFLFGVVLQRNFDRLGPLLRGRVAYFFLAYLAAALLLARLDLPVGGNYLNPLSALLLGLTVISAAYNLPTLSNKILRGQDVSYGLYIYHVVVLNVLVARGLTQRWSYLLLALSLSLTLAYLSWMLIERRALGLKAKLTRRDERFDGGDQHASA